MSINWGSLQQGGGFQNALAMGMQMGQFARQRQDEKEYKNALAAFDPSKPETLKPIMQADPRTGMQLQGQMQQQMAAQQESDLSARALQGDEDALTQLATVNFDKWAKIDTRQKAEALQESTLLGEAALDILQVPYGEQRRARLITYAQQFPQFAEKINEVAFLPPAEQETQLRAVIAQAKMVGKLHEMERPSYQAIPEGGTLVNTRDPGAVQQFQQGAAPQIAEGQTATNPQTGQRIVFSNGAWRPM